MDRVPNRRQRAIKAKAAGRLRPFLGGDIFEMFDQHSSIDTAQTEPLAAGEYRHRHLADFRRCEDEFGVRRRLFQRLEQRVEGGARKHMHFVENVDLVACAHGRVTNGIIDLAHVLDAVVRRGIHFQHIGVAAFDDGLAVHAHHRHLDCGFLHRTVGQFVIQRTRENARSRGLADAAHAVRIRPVECDRLESI